MSTIATIQDLEERRRQAMLAGDAATLDELLADELAYTHSNADTDGKALFLDRVRSGYYRYQELAFVDPDIRIVGDTVLIMGRMTGKVVLGEELRVLNTRTTTVWVRKDGRWQLLAFQGTKLPTA